MKENLKLGLILLIVTAIAGLSLGVAYAVTKEPIAQQAVIANNNAMREVLPKAESFKKSSAAIPQGSIIKEVNEGYSGSNLVGYTIKVTPKGFGGIIEMVVGISSDHKVSGIKILSHSETPGLGANAPSPKFSGQFKDKSIAAPLEVVKTGAAKDNQIDAITGATITSRAVTSGVNEAINFYTSTLKGGAK